MQQFSLLSQKRSDVSEPTGLHLCVDGATKTRMPARRPLNDKGEHCIRICHHESITTEKITYNIQKKRKRILFFIFATYF